MLGVVAMTAIAMPIAAPVASAKPSSAHANLIKAVTKADAQAKKLITRSRACPAAAAQRAVTIKVRAAQVKGLKKARPTSLRLRQMRISVHSQRLAVALSKCSTQAPAQSPAPLQLERSTGTGGSNGAVGAPIGAIPLDALGGMVNAAGLLDGVALPTTIPVVDTAGLATTAACLASGAVCVGVDQQAIGAALTDAVRQRVQELPVLGGILNPLLAQVNAALATGPTGSLLGGTDPASLFQVERTGDTTFRITVTPGTSLASLVNLLGNSGGLPADVLGIVQVHP